MGVLKVEHTKRLREAIEKMRAEGVIDATCTAIGKCAGISEETVRSRLNYIFHISPSRWESKSPKRTVGFYSIDEIARAMNCEDARP